MSKTTVLYKDVAPGAEENAKVSAFGYAEDSDFALLPFGVSPSPIATLEPDRWKLDGTFVLRDTETIGFWSSELSGYDGAFSAAPSIEFKFTKQYSSVGISVIFDEATGEYCSEINVKWYQGNDLKADVDFYPDSSNYFCENTVTSYDRIVITFLRTSIPRRYAKVNMVVFGIFRKFGMSEIRSASVVNEMSGITETLPVSTFKWTLDSRENVQFMFQLKQPVEIANNGNLLGVYYIDNHKRKTERIYEIECYDAIGVLDETAFSGGIYSNKSAKSLLNEIVGEDFTIEYADDVQDINISGVIQSGSKREAMQQVLFAWGVCLATDASRKIKIFNLDAILSEIGTDRTFSGGSTEISSLVTEVRVTAHSYAEDANGSVEIGNKKYTDTRTVYSIKNTDVTANDKQNVKTVEHATLVSPSNVQAVAQRVYDWYQRRVTSNDSIVWEKEALGDYVSLPNGWNEFDTGNITKMEIKLSNTVIAKCTAVGQGG